MKGGETKVRPIRVPGGKNYSAKIPSPLEKDIHMAVVSLLRASAKPGVVWFHIPNGEKRSPATAAKLKRMGVLPGVADLCIMIPEEGVHWLELKSGGGRLSSQQQAFLASAINAGSRAVGVAETFESARGFLETWGAIRAKVAA
jgi:hypothetical protein